MEGTGPPDYILDADRLPPELRATALEGFPRLEAYVFADDDYHPNPMPRQLPPALVLHFARARLGNLIGARELWKVRDLFCFYSLSEAVPLLAAHLRSPERRDHGAERPTPTFAQQLPCIACAGEIGTPEERALATNRFAQVLATSDAERLIRGLLICLGAIEPPLSVDPVERRLDELIRRRSTVSGDFASRLALSEIKAVKANDLALTRWAHAIKAHIAAQPIGPDAIRTLVDTYLHLDHAIPVHTDGWSARRLRSLGLAPNARALVVDELQRRVEMYHDSSEPDPETAAYAGLDCLLALRFFGVPPSTEQIALLQRKSDHPAKLLAPDMFLFASESGGEEDGMDEVVVDD